MIGAKIKKRLKSTNTDYKYYKNNFGQFLKQTGRLDCCKMWFIICKHSMSRVSSMVKERNI